MTHEETLAAIRRTPAAQRLLKLRKQYSEKISVAQTLRIRANTVSREADALQVEIIQIHASLPEELREQL
jgi:hypothetical protein